MKNLSAIALTFCVIALPVRVSFAQSKTATPSPLAATVAPAVVYESPFAGFVPLTEPTVSPASTWREVNKAVGSYDSMSATMDDMPGMAMPAGHDMQSMSMGTDKKAMPEGHDMKSMPTKPAMPMGHDMKSMPMGHDMKSMPMNHDMPMGHDMKNMSKTQDVNATPKSNDLPMSHDMKSMPKDHDMKSMPMKKDMPMNMDMPGMKEMK